MALVVYQFFMEKIVVRWLVKCLANVHVVHRVAERGWNSEGKAWIETKKNLMTSGHCGCGRDLIEGYRKAKPDRIAREDIHWSMESQWGEEPYDSMGSMGSMGFNCNLKYWMWYPLVITMASWKISTLNSWAKTSIQSYEGKNMHQIPEGFVIWLLQTKQKYAIICNNVQ